MDKISILLPTYNDCDYIERTLDSVRTQKYSNWELLICDDGSIDDTKNVVKSYIKKYKLSDRIKYYYQDNADQLNALINILKYATGNYVYILHSDDLLYDENTLLNCIEYIKENNVDALISDLSIIDKDDNITGIQNVYKYENNTSIISLQLLWLGRNLYNDFPFAKMDVFKKYIYNNYLIWNGPFWLNLDNDSMLNVINTDFNIRKYRVYDGNYLNSPSAKLNVINGEIRVVTNLLAHYHIPLYRFQYCVFRLFNKLKLTSFYRPVYKHIEEKNKYEIIKFVLNKRFTDVEISKNVFLDSLLGFYKNTDSIRKVEINIPKNLPIYYGKDMRVFNKKILNNELEAFYIDFLNDIKSGIKEIIVKNNKEKNIMTDITKFLCIYPYVKISIKK